MRKPYPRLHAHALLLGVVEAPRHDGRGGAVDLDDPRIAMTHGLAPTENGPRFHQQMVYAVATSVWTACEAALGFPIDVIKIDRSFVLGMTTSGDDFAIVQAVALGQLPRDSGVAMLGAFFAMPPDLAEARGDLMVNAQPSFQFHVISDDPDDNKFTDCAITAGADFVITGDVTEFGRKEVGDQQLFGILGRGKSQIAYSKVSLNVVDALTSEVIFSVQGAGEYALSNREVIGFGGTASYDSTLNGKVLDLAIREAVNRLVEGVESGQWKPAQ